MSVVRRGIEDEVTGRGGALSMICQLKGVKLKLVYDADEPQLNAWESDGVW